MFDDVYMGGPPVPKKERICMLHIIIDMPNVILEFIELQSFFIGSWILDDNNCVVLDLIEK